MDSSKLYIILACITFSILILILIVMFFVCKKNKEYNRLVEFEIDESNLLRDTTLKEKSITVKI